MVSTEHPALSELRQIVGKSGVLTQATVMRPYLEGTMTSKASRSVLAVVQAQSLVALWRTLNLAAKYDLILIPQAANTGLTGGSTPYGDYERPVLVLSMQKLKGIQLINDAKELIALPAATLQQLERTLAPYQREPHSVLGSSCVGASVIGGICNNSGGALVQRGPAYTEQALFARLNERGDYELINHLGIELGDHPETILQRLENADYQHDDIQPAPAPQHTPYHEHLRDIHAPTPARYNSDPKCLYEAAGSSGRIIVFAVRLPTYPKAQHEQVYLYSTDDENALTMLRRQWLASDKPLPILAEYLDQAYVHTTLQYGKDTCLIMNHLNSQQIGSIYRLRSKLENYLSPRLIERSLQTLAHFLPAPIGKKAKAQLCRHQHHLIIKMADDGIEEMENFLKAIQHQHGGSYQRVNAKVGKQLLTLRFAGTAAMLRYHQLHAQQYGALLSTDIALPRNAQHWREQLPPSLAAQCKTFFSMGHFFCHVFHQDYFLHPHTDPNTFKQQLLDFYSSQHIKYPAEHNVGHLYQASEKQIEFYRQLDPTNSLNPGIGHTTKRKNWQKEHESAILKSSDQSC